MPSVFRLKPTALVHAFFWLCASVIAAAPFAGQSLRAATASVPSFTVTASPASVVLTAGSSIAATVAITGANGFQASVSLSATGLPSGVSASFSPHAVLPGATAALTLTATTSAAPTTASITITGTSGALQGTASMSLAFQAAPSFTLVAAPASLAVVAGSKISCKISVTGANGFCGPVTLAPTGMPAGVTAVFDPATASPSTPSTLTLTALSTASAYSANVAVTGSSGTLKESLAVPLTVSAAPGFSLSVDPPALALKAGSTGTANIAVAPVGGFKSSVTLSAGSLPEGVTAVFKPVSIVPGGSSVLTLTAAANAPESSATIAIDGSSQALTSAATLNATVALVPDFTIVASASSLTLTVPGAISDSVFTVAWNGLSGSVSVSVSGLPAGVTGTLTPSVVELGGTALLNLSASSSTSASSGNITITGVCGGVTHTISLALKVTAAPQFELTAAPSALTLTDGSSVSTTIRITAGLGFPGDIQFVEQGNPSGVTGKFSANPAAPGSTVTLTLDATATAAPFTGTLTVVGAMVQNAGVTTSIKISLTIPASPQFQLSAYPASLTITSGSSVTTSVAATPSGGFNGSVTLALTGLPAGVTGVFVPPSLAPAGSSTLTLTAAASASASSAPFKVTGASGKVSDALPVSLTVTAVPGFDLSANPSSLVLGPGSTTATTIGVTALNGFSGPVALAATGFPSGITGALTPGSVAPGSTASLQLTASASAGSSAASITITGTSGALTETAAIPLNAGPIITTVAGDGSRGLSGNGGPALSASLDPDGIAFDSLGNYYIADNTTATDDPHNCNVRKVDTTGVITLVAGNGQCPSIGSGSDGDGGPATSAQFLPVAITVDTAGNLYIADFSLDRVRKVDTHGTITTVAGSISCQGVSSDGLSLGDGGAANQAFLCNVRGVTVDNNGNLFIADSGNFRVRKVDGNGIITTVAGDGDQSYTGSGNDGDGGPATSAHLSSAAATAIDATGNLYIADYDPGYGQWPSRIRKVDTNGIITTFAGTGVCGYSGDGGPATSAQICTPFSLAINAAGDLFIADYWSFRVRKVGASGIITTVAGTGQMGFSGDGGLARLAKLTPYSIAFDASGNLYIVDALNYRIREVTHP